MSNVLQPRNKMLSQNFLSFTASHSLCSNQRHFSQNYGQSSAEEEKIETKQHTSSKEVILAFENRDEIVKKLAQVFLANRSRQQALARNPEHQRYLQLIVMSNFYGFGKTRLGIEFLPKFNEYLTQDVAYKEQLAKAYGADNVNQLATCKLLVVDLRAMKSFDNIDDLCVGFVKFVLEAFAEHINRPVLDVRQEFLRLDNSALEKSNESIVKTLAKFLGSKNTFLFLDEIGKFGATKFPGLNSDVNYFLQIMYQVWENIFMPLLRQPGITLYTAGRGEC
jgi:hypothetical protein